MLHAEGRWRPHLHADYYEHWRPMKAVPLVNSSEETMMLFWDNYGRWYTFAELCWSLWALDGSRKFCACVCDRNGEAAEKLGGIHVQVLSWSWCLSPPVLEWLIDICLSMQIVEFAWFHYLFLSGSHSWTVTIAKLANESPWFNYSTSKFLIIKSLPSFTHHHCQPHGSSLAMRLFVSIARHSLIAWFRSTIIQDCISITRHKQNHSSTIMCVGRLKMNTINHHNMSTVNMSTVNHAAITGPVPAKWNSQLVAPVKTMTLISHEWTIINT